MDNIIERQHAIVSEHIRGENEYNWQAVYDTFVQDERAHYDVMPMGATFRGIEGVRGFYHSIATAVPDLRVEVVAEYDVPGCSIREVVISGTHEGEFAGIAPRGNKVRVEMAAIYKFNDDATKLISERIYYDQAGLVAQMVGGQGAVA